MTLPSKQPIPERSRLLFDFPIKLYTALQAIRLYPIASTQVRRCNDLLFRAFQSLQTTNPGDGAVTLAYANGKIFVCGEQLLQKEQARPQIQSLIALFSRFDLHSFTFSPSFSPPQCAAFIQTASVLLEDRELPESVATLLDKAGITTVSTDSKRYVAIPGGIQDDALHSELDISDEELVDLILGKATQKTIPEGSTELVQELINLLPPPDSPHQNPEEVTAAVVNFLHMLTEGPDRHSLASTEVEQLSQALSGLDPDLFARLVVALPPTPDADSILRPALHQLTSRQMDTLVVNLVAQLADTEEADVHQRIATPGNPLNRLVSLAQEHTPGILQTIARNLDAQRLLLNPDTTLSALPEQLLKRMRQPEWSASVLTAAAHQAVVSQPQAAGLVDCQAFNRLLELYEKLHGRSQQAAAVVARQAGAQLATMEGLALGDILVQCPKGPFGEQLYDQVVNQIPDEVLNETLDRLTPRQLNRMVATLIHGVPVGKEGATEFQIANGALFKRLTRTKKGPEITTAVAHNIDAQRLLLNFGSSLDHLPEHLLKRLHQPEWSASVLVAAAQYAVDAAKEKGNTDELTCFERTLAACDNLIDQKKQEQVASRVAAGLPPFDEQELGLILERASKSPFGKQLCRLIIRQLSEDKLERLASHFQALRAPDDEASKKSFKLLQELVETNRQQKLQREELKLTSLKSRFDDLIRGDLAALKQTEVQQALPDEISELLTSNQKETADTLIRQLVTAMRYERPDMRITVFRNLAAIAERLAQIGQWERIEKLLPTLQQGLLLDDIGEQAVQQAMTAIGGLAEYHLAEEHYPQAEGIIQNLHLLSSQDPHAEATNHLVRSQALAILKYLCSRAVLVKLMDLYLHSETQQEVAGSC